MKYFFVLFAWICTVSLATAQDKFKFGEVPQDLLEMTVYDKDSAASAFVVYENQDVYYNWNSSYSDFELVSEYTVRIKILTSDGIDRANGSVTFYKGSNNTSTEDVSGLNGWTYNLENGKVVKEKLSKEYVFTEDVTENIKRLKFALPSAKAGSVIEYKYTFRSPFYYNSRKITFQRSIPVKYSYFRIAIPEYFQFNRETRGYEPIKTKTTPTNMSFIIGGQTLRCSGEESSAEVFDLPALKDESFVWNYDDFMSGILLELKRVVITGVYYKDYAQSWDKVVEVLMDHEKFGAKLKNKGLFKDELAALQSAGSEDEEKLRSILNLVRDKVKWNERNTLYIDNPAKALKDGVGSSGEINSLFFNAVRNAGYDAAVVIMSLRSNGRIPLTYPSRNYFNYFIVQVKSGEKTYYLDATRSYCDVNVIPVNCLVDNALCIVDKNFNWVDMTRTGNNTVRTNLLVAYNEDGILTGKKSEVRTGECIFSFKQDYDSEKDEAEFIKKIETNNDISVTDYKIDKKQTSIVELYNFTSNTYRLDGENLLTIQPMLFETMRNNPFKQETRKLPVEFNYPEDERINVNFTIPDGYALDEAPKSERFVFGDNWIDFSYLVQQVDEKHVQIAYRFKLDVCIVPANQYAELRDFISKVYAKCQEVLIFKKV
jgi:transglutaminase-like putative cysteine protease